MILVDNSKQCSAILRFIAQPALESCPEPVRQVFDASRFSEFHTFLDGVMNDAPVKAARVSDRGLRHH